MYARLPDCFAHQIEIHIFIGNKKFSGESFRRVFGLGVGLAVPGVAELVLGMFRKSVFANFFFRGFRSDSGAALFNDFGNPVFGQALNRSGGRSVGQAVGRTVGQATDRPTLWMAFESILDDF